MADIARCDGVAQFKRTGSDNQVRKWHGDAYCRLLTADSSDDLGCVAADGMNAKVPPQIVQKLPAVLRLSERHQAYRAGYG
jgi:hypothetical protein